MADNNMHYLSCIVQPFAFLILHFSFFIYAYSVPGAYNGLIVRCSTVTRRRTSASACWSRSRLSFCVHLGAAWAVMYLNKVSRSRSRRADRPRVIQITYAGRPSKKSDAPTSAPSTRTAKNSEERAVGDRQAGQGREVGGRRHDEHQREDMNEERGSARRKRG